MITVHQVFEIAIRVIQYATVPSMLFKRTVRRLRGSMINAINFIGFMV